MSLPAPCHELLPPQNPTFTTMFLSDVTRAPTRASKLASGDDWTLSRANA